MVDIINGSLRVNELDEVLDNLNNVLLRQHTHIHVGLKTQLLVDAVTAHVAQVVALVGEEEVLDDLSCRSVVGRVGIAQLTVDVEHGLLLGVRRVFGQSVEDDTIVLCRGLALVYEDVLRTTLKDVEHILLGDDGFALHDDLVTLDGDHLAGVLIYEVLVPALQHTGGELRTYDLLQGLLVDLHLLGEVEYLENVFIVLETDGSQKCGDGQLLLTVDVSVHHVVDVGGKLYPRTLERDDTCRVEQRSVGVYVLSEEHTG